MFFLTWVVYVRPCQLKLRKQTPGYFYFQHEVHFDSFVYLGLLFPSVWTFPKSYVDNHEDHWVGIFIKAKYKSAGASATSCYYYFSLSLSLWSLSKCVLMCMIENDCVQKWKKQTCQTKKTPGVNYTEVETVNTLQLCDLSLSYGQIYRRFKEWWSN